MPTEDDATAAPLRYRLLTGPDTSEFCERVSAALDNGYELHGSPSITYDPEAKTRVVAQAIILANRI